MLEMPSVRTPLVPNRRCPPSLEVGFLDAQIASDFKSNPPAIIAAIRITGIQVRFPPSFPLSLNRSRSDSGCDLAGALQFQIARFCCDLRSWRLRSCALVIWGWLASVSSSSSSRVLQGKSSSPRPQSYSLEGLRKLHESLSQFRTSTFEQKGASEALVETVREITEALVWGEKNDPSLFDFFCEKSILVDFIRVLGMKQVPREVNVQLLQTLSMLMQNLRRPTSVYYMLSTVLRLAARMVPL